MGDNEMIRRRILDAEADEIRNKAVRERRRLERLISNIRSGNVVTTETLELVEKWGNALESIASHPADSPEAVKMARIALEALAEAS